MCFKRVHNFTQDEIKQHHMSIITTSYYVLISPNSASKHITRTIRGRIFTMINYTNYSKTFYY